MTLRIPHLLAALALGAAAPAGATILFYDNFNGYADGALETVSGGVWNYFAGTTDGAVLAPSVQVTTGALVFDYTTQTSLLDGYYAASLGGAQIGTLYYAFDLTVLTEADSTGGITLAQLTSNNTTASNGRGRLWYGGTDPVAADTARLSLTNDSGTSADRDFLPTTLVEGITYRVVVRWDPSTPNTGTTAWLNPTEEGSGGFTSDDGATAPTSLGAFAFRNRGNVNIDAFQIDNLVVSTTFAEAAVPEPAYAAGLIGVAALGLGLWRRRQQRKA